MCAQFILKIKANQLSKQLGVKIPENIDDINERFLPHKKAPVVIHNGTHCVLKFMNFGLIPSWSKEPRVKFATHNARLESITEKPTWRVPFAKKHCFVPMTAFIEPIYTNQYAGNMVQFFDQNHQLLLAAGIYDEWINKESGEVIESFSVITDTPPSFIQKIGHDRCPLFIDDDSAHQWLQTSQDMSSNQWIHFLTSHKKTFNFGVEIDRPMKPGWEKRK